MESRTIVVRSEGVLMPLLESTDTFESEILTPLRSSHLYEESKLFFRYTSAALVNNPELEEKYNAFRARKKNAGYTEEELKESYGFLLFDDSQKANALGKTGVLTGNSTCTTLGDPSKGVYISMHSDCLDSNRWYHGKSGYIAIIKLIKGRVEKVAENYTLKFTEPTMGFDCHVSDQLPSVSAKTSSFLAFERTQYYIYELLDDKSYRTASSPAAACPFAIVSFSYTDSKACSPAPQEKSDLIKQVCYHVQWKGKLQFGSSLYGVDLRSATGTIIPASLPSVVKVDRVMSMSNVLHFTPKAVFEALLTNEICLDGYYWTVCKLRLTEVETNSSFNRLLTEMKKQDVAFVIPLGDGGFFMLLHCTHFLTYDDTESSANGVLQGVFVFPESRVITPDTKMEGKKTARSLEVLQVLPILNYAESELEKNPMDRGQPMCQRMLDQMQSYATLINPEMPKSPSKEVSFFPNQYDVAEIHKNIYSCPEWTTMALQNLKSYISKPETFQLPLSDVSDILAGKQDQREDFEDEVYICLSSPEEPQVGDLGVESENPLTNPQCPVRVEDTSERGFSNHEEQTDNAKKPQTVIPEDLRAGVSIKANDKGLPNPGKVSMREHSLVHPVPEDLPAELIVSITREDRRAGDKSLRILGALPMSKEPLRKEDTCPMERKRKKLHRGFSKVQQKACKPSDNLPNAQKSMALTEIATWNCTTNEQEKELDQLSLFGSPKLKWRKCHKRKRIYGKLSPKKRRRRPAIAGFVMEEKKLDIQKTITGGKKSIECEYTPLKRKTERSDLKPIISDCGKILVPHGSAKIADLNKLETSLPAKSDQSVGNHPFDVSMICPDIRSLEHISCLTSEKRLNETNDPKKLAADGNHQSSANDIPEQNFLKGTDSCEEATLVSKMETASIKGSDSTNCSLQQSVQEKQIDELPSRLNTQEDEAQLGSLKVALSKRKTILNLLEAILDVENSTHQEEPLVKKKKVECEVPKFDETPTESVKNLSSVDSNFSPLTAEDHLKKVQTTQVKKCEKNQKIRPSAFKKRRRVKMLKRLQGVTEENIKKTWWLHFQTPACNSSDIIKHNDFTSDSVPKTVEKNMKTVCSSPDALNLLADLALGGSHGKIPPQPIWELERKSEKKFDRAKIVSIAEQKSVLHALLKHPAARPVESFGSSSTVLLVGDSELKRLIFAEHDYSLPTSSSLLLGLSGSQLPVSPSCVSTDVPDDLTEYGNEDKTLQSSGTKEELSDRDRTPEPLNKNRQKLKCMRSVASMKGSIKITRQWQESYDFDLDSKLTSDSKCKVVVRALHGPWDRSIQETNEEMRLIFNMWIGLFYSRTTARFFNVELLVLDSCSNESYLSKMLTAPTMPKLKTTSDSIVDVTHSFSPSGSTCSNQVNDKKMLESGAEILDLSMRNLNSKSSFTEPTDKEKSPDVTVFSKEKAASVQLCNGSKSQTKPDEVTTVTGENVKEYSKEVAAENRKTLPPKTVGWDHPNLSGIWLNRNPLLSSMNGRRIPVKSKTTKQCDGNLRKFATDLENTRIPNDCLAQKHETYSSNPNAKKNKMLPKKRKMSNPFLETSSKDDVSPSRKLDSVSKTNLFERDKFVRDDLKFVSPRQDNAVNGNLDKRELLADPPRKDKLDESSCLSSMDPDQELKLQVCDGPIKKCTSEHKHQAKLDNQIRLAVDGRYDSHTSCQDPTPSTDESLNNSSLLKNCKDVPFVIDTQRTHPSVLKRASYSFERFRKDMSRLLNKIGVSNKEKSSNLPRQTNDQDTAELQSNAENEEKTVSKENAEVQCDSSESDSKGVFETGMLDNTSNCGSNVSEPLPVHQTTEPQEPTQGQTVMPLITGSTDGTSPLPSKTCAPSQSCDTNTTMTSVQKNDDPLFSQDGPRSCCNTPSMDECPLENNNDSSVDNNKNILDDSESSGGMSGTSFPEAYVSQPLQQKIERSTEFLPSQSASLCSSDIEQRTLRVLESLDHLLLNPKQPEVPILSEANEMKETHDEKHCPVFKRLSFCSTSNYTDDSLENKNIVAEEEISIPIPKLEDLPTETSNGIVPLGFTAKMEQLLGVKLQCKKEVSPVPQLHFENAAHKTFQMSENSSHKLLVSPDFIQDASSIRSSSSSTHESRSYNQRPVLAVKPSKTDEGTTNLPLNIPDVEAHLNTFPSYSEAQLRLNSTPPETSVVDKKDSSEELNDDFIEDTKISLSTNTMDSLCISERKNNSHLNSGYKYEKKEHLENTMCTHSPFLTQTSAEILPNFDDESQGLVDFSEKLKSEKNMEENDKKSLTGSAQDADDSRPPLSPQSSILCTFLNKGGEGSSLLDQIGQRLQEVNPTQTSIEQESLIFMEQMKNLMKTYKSRSTSTKEPLDNLKSSLVAINSKGTNGPLNTSGASFAAQKIRVEITNEKNIPALKEGRKKSSETAELSQREPTWISNVTTECAKLYETRMQHICSAKKSQSRSKTSRIQESGSNTNTTIENLDVCEKVKKELDKTFQSNLNAVVKKSCKAKRFFILETSDDPFFEETKRQLQSEGHTATQPFEFFLCTEGCSSLLIILKNEDIAEHVCKVPHLLELKMSPDVQFTGIDEPDDVVNLTYQELFTRGGFIVLDKSTLECLSLSNMREIATVLEKLSTTGKWKWMLHYKDSRHIKENARLSQEANEKKKVFSRGLDAGTLEVLPYHECDLISKDQPDYLTCLLHLQVQNITLRYSIFITDRTDSIFEKNGFLTVTLENFLTKFSSESSEPD